MSFRGPAWLVRETGLTSRQLDYWLRRLGVPGNGTGTRREISTETLLALHAIKAELDRHDKTMAAILGPNPMSPREARRAS